MSVICFLDIVYFTCGYFGSELPHLILIQLLELFPIVYGCVGMFLYISLNYWPVFVSVCFKGEFPLISMQRERERERETPFDFVVIYRSRCVWFIFVSVFVCRLSHNSCTSNRQCFFFFFFFNDLNYVELPTNIFFVNFLIFCGSIDGAGKSTQ